MSSTELASGKLLADEPAPHVVRLRISNPDKRGALDHEILDALGAAVADADARCLLITGDGPVFSAGYDIGNFSEDTFAEAAEKLVAHPFTEAMDAIEAFPYPVVAAVNGHAIGGGLELAVTCDIRIAARGVRLGMPPAKIGLIYGHTGLRRFIDVVGVARTKELFLTGLTVEGPRAEEIGLVHAVTDDHELPGAALELAETIALNAPISMRGNKQAIETLAAFPRLTDEQERELVELREACFSSEDFREGIQAFSERRQPRWTGR